MADCLSRVGSARAAHTEFPYHALQGISLPLSILAVAAWRRLSRMRGKQVLAVLAIAAASVPGLAFELKLFRDSEASPVTPYILNANDAAALSYLDHLLRPGGVLAREYIGATVPALTGRETWVGQWTWTPHYTQRVLLTNELMNDQMSAADARRFVAETGAKFLLADCGVRVPLERLLGPMAASERSFGCAAVYRLSRAS